MQRLIPPQGKGVISTTPPGTASTRSRCPDSSRMPKSASAPNDGPAALLGQHLVYLRHFEIQDDRVILTFGAPVSHIFRFAIKEAGVKYSSQLKDALARAGVVLEKLEEPIGLEPR